MNNLIILQQIFEVCIVPLLGILTAFLVQYIKSKTQEIAASTDSELSIKYNKLISDTIISCVIATNQTYVDSLKNKDVFTKEAQQEAFIKTRDAVVDILNEDSKKYISESFGDVEKYLTVQIEAIINKIKNQ